MDLSNLSVVDLRNLHEKIKQELKQRERKDVDAAREEIYAIAHRLGLPLKDLIGNGIRTSGKTGTVAMKYRNPSDTSQQWTGRGRQPKWIKQALDAGVALDSFCI